EWRFLNLDLAAAFAAFARFGEHGTEEASARFLSRALLLAECGASERALQELRDGIAFDEARERLRPRTPEKWIALGSIALQEGDANAAVEAAARAAERRSDLRSQLRVAMLLFRCGAIE